MESFSYFIFFRGLIKVTLAPMPIFWLLLISGFVFYLISKKRAAKLLFSSSVFWLLLITTPFLPRIMLAKLENQYPPFVLSSKTNDSIYAQNSINHILVLGNGYEADDRLSYCGQLFTSGLARLTEGIRLFHILPRGKLIFSGNAGHQPRAQAEISALAAQELGVDSTAIYTICEPWNTRTEAIEYFKHYGTAFKLYLVTDAAHMPRAIMHFRNAGLNPIPVPVNFIIRKNLEPNKYTYYFPGINNIGIMEIVFQEYLGILWAKMGGD